MWNMEPCAQFLKLAILDLDPPFNSRSQRKEVPTRQKYLEESSILSTVSGHRVQFSLFLAFEQHYMPSYS
jgi:hypothetical protein